MKRKRQPISYADITLHGSIQKSGIHIDIRYFGYNINNIIVLPSEYMSWRTMTRNQKEALIHTKINPTSVDNDIHLVTAITHTAVDVVDSLIRKAQADQAMRFTLPKY